MGLADVQSALGHPQIQTTGRYLHARQAHELADAFSRAQGGSGQGVGRRVTERRSDQLAVDEAG